jgi:hypothetical protein
VLRRERNEAMHWFWRASIAVIGLIATEVFYFRYGWVAVQQPAYAWIAGLKTGWAWPWEYRLAGTLAALPLLLIASLAFSIGFGFPISRGYGQTRCRKCSAVLRALSEPACPRCGERI